MSDLSSHHGKGKADLSDVRIHEKADARPSVDHPRRNDRENLPDGHNQVTHSSKMPYGACFSCFLEFGYHVKISYLIQP